MTIVIALMALAAMPMQDLGVPMQNGGASLQAQTPEAGGGKRTEKALARRIEDLGRMYEVLGACAGSMDAAEVESILRQAQSNPSMGPFLLQRYEKGFRHPKNDEWCHVRMGKAVDRF